MTLVARPHTTLAVGSTTFDFYLGDCIPILGGLAAGAVDVVVTSPPYNLGVRYRTYDDTMPRREYLSGTTGRATGGILRQCMSFTACLASS